MGVFLCNPGMKRLIPGELGYNPELPWVLLGDLKFYSDYLGKTVVVPAGYQSDFASVPWFFRRLLPKDGPYTLAAIIHDWFCDQSLYSSKEASEVLREAAVDLRTPMWQVWMLYYGTLWFGPQWG